MPKNAGDLPLVQWPLFLLASKVTVVIGKKKRKAHLFLVIACICACCLNTWPSVLIWSIFFNQ